MKKGGEERYQQVQVHKAGLDLSRSEYVYPSHGTMIRIVTTGFSELCFYKCVCVNNLCRKRPPRSWR